MSAKFCTPIPIDAAAIKALLPPGADIERELVWNHATNCVELRWSSNLFHSPYSFHHEFTVDALRCKELPKFVTLKQPAPRIPEIVENSKPAEIGNDNEKTVDVVKKRSRKGTA